MYDEAHCKINRCILVLPGRSVCKLSVKVVGIGIHELLDKYKYVNESRCNFS